MFFTVLKISQYNLGTFVKLYLINTKAITGCHKQRLSKDHEPGQLGNCAFKDNDVCHDNCRQTMVKFSSISGTFANWTHES